MGVCVWEKHLFLHLNLFEQREFKLKSKYTTELKKINQYSFRIPNLVETIKKWKKVNSPLIALRWGAAAARVGATRRRRRGR